MTEDCAILLLPVEIVSERDLAPARQRSGVSHLGAAVWKARGVDA